ncbi:ImmA/IrrE family metallo-endopeptidase [Paenibacillus alba]|uniref:ImmA/IrrE family metallo-endopeptidase n=1 Tax=Paenibacillus alba TaxID=1197127 RepID=A0ABU6GDI8_9BACL|nr:ImmA/IrrE family metallo-endopeptidase [Paenibacillus alba]MEC0232280.1 ImmA/IrrE family metallo-endopeptidase [Paenibacillus alba]NQX68058.1 ImmA/IrrE family metallo-endopeptidase [Paenibacillus alba]
MLYEKLLKEAAHLSIDVSEQNLLPTTHGLYADNTIWINKSLSTHIEKRCILAEELGHYHTSSGDITDQSDVRNRKQELLARQWAHHKLIPLERIVDAHKARAKGRYEIAEFLGVTEAFLQAAIDRYLEKYGLYVVLNEQYAIKLDPLGVVEIFQP